MSLTRQFLREFRPLFRMLEEPFGRPHPALTTRNSVFNGFNDPFFNFPSVSGPAVDLSEEGNHYIVEAELPGVKKENVEIKIGDNGQSLTIEGRKFSGSPRNAEHVTPAASTEAGEVGNADAAAAGSGSDAVVQQNDGPTQISAERTFTSQSSFSRTIWLPRPVASEGVSAKLADGILVVRIPKAEDKASVKVNIE
ncbi:HSP20-like chaperone [Rickenella mellea]|uniref:HSP20-like chaperone n=1 Tax=Rickenella mellea TaxID=50990 RepID=A0A4Y7Q3P8_9AGAM|nr:HSP20-like chaperone [Rickenella mellea]